MFPGAEGWRSMYPYFTRFQPEDDQRFWFYNSMHFPEPMPAFDTVTAEIPYSAIGANTARIFVFPTTLGIEHRIVNGRIYITAIPVTDPAEIARRAAIFEERAGYYYANWNQLQAGWKARMERLIEEIGSIQVPPLPVFDDADVVTSSTGVAQNHYVRENFHRCLDLYSKMWHHHTEFLMLGYGAYVVFFEFCKQAFPEIGDQAVARMVAGIDVIMYRPDDELRGLARLAVQYGVDDLFTDGCDPGEVLSALQERGEAGPALARRFQRGPGAVVPCVHRGRVLPPPPELERRPDRAVRRAAPVRGPGPGGQEATRPTEALRAERERIAAEYRACSQRGRARGVRPDAGPVPAGVPVRGGPQVLLRALVHHAVLRQDPRVRRAAGPVRGAGRGRGHLPAAPHRDRPGAVGRDAGLGRGRRAARRWYWQPIVSSRKRMLAALRDWSPPPALGPVPEALNDPAVRMLWGVTAESGSGPGCARRGADARLRGASSGVVEGTGPGAADVNEIGQIRDGEILVCPVTAPSWAPVFGKIKAAVSDIGGTMSHAAIVAREYGMPAVVGTGHATKRIKTGQRVRVDGDRGIVPILS